MRFGGAGCTPTSGRPDHPETDLRALSVIPCLHGWRSTSDQEICPSALSVQPGLADLVFGDRDGRVGVARAPLGVDRLDVRRRARAEADVGGLERLRGLCRRIARALEHPLAAADAFISRADRDRASRSAALSVTSDAAMPPGARGAVPCAPRNRPAAPELEQRAPAGLGREHGARMLKRQLEYPVQRRVPVLRTVGDDAARGLDLGRESLMSVRRPTDCVAAAASACGGMSNAGSFVASIGCSAASSTPSAPACDRAPAAPVRAAPRHSTMAAAHAAGWATARAGLEPLVGIIEDRLGGVARPLLGLDHPVRGDHRQVQLGGRHPDLPANVVGQCPRQPGAGPPLRPTRPPCPRIKGHRDQIESKDTFCGDTTSPSTSRAPSSVMLEAFRRDHRQRGGSRLLKQRLGAQDVGRGNCDGRIGGRSATDGFIRR